MAADNLLEQFVLRCVVDNNRSSLPGSTTPITAGGCPILHQLYVNFVRSMDTKVIRELRFAGAEVFTRHNRIPAGIILVPENIPVWFVIRHTRNSRVRSLLNKGRDFRVEGDVVGYTKELYAMNGNVDLAIRSTMVRLLSPNGKIPLDTEEARATTSKVVEMFLEVIDAIEILRVYEDFPYPPVSERRGMLMEPRVHKLFKAVTTFREYIDNAFIPYLCSQEAGRREYHGFEEEFLSPKSRTALMEARTKGDLKREQDREARDKKLHNDVSPPAAPGEKNRKQRKLEERQKFHLQKVAERKAAQQTKKDATTKKGVTQKGGGGAAGGGSPSPAGISGTNTSTPSTTPVEPG